MSHAESRTVWIRATIERYEAPLLSYCVSIVGDRERARDVVQDAFFRLVEAEDWQALREHVKAWLYRVCRNRALDVTKKERPMQSATPEELERQKSLGPDPGEQLEQRRTASALTTMIAALPEKQKEVVQLKFQEGLSYREISAVTGHSTGNVGYLLHCGVKTLREALAAEGGVR
ncbi:MAG: sigma-70 family RNA polymerase sigma factor [Deltaproteobacteria bacterium]|nr:sigma-70 family RNA polymerase sigma factor [Deltaproteobacteria bacterium]